VYCGLRLHLRFVPPFVLKIPAIGYFNTVFFLLYYMAYRKSVILTNNYPLSNRGRRREREEIIMPNLYSLPDYYDIAFTYDRNIDTEIDFIRTCFDRHSLIEVKNILEAACGSGMFLRGLPRHGYRVTGYDLSPEMVEYANRSIACCGLESQANAVEGDMCSIRFPGAFDAALTLISSLSYLTTDADLSAHFRIMSETVRPGGVYIVEVFFVCTDLEYEKYPYETWTVEEEHLQIDVSWKIENYDYAEKLRNIRLNMDILDNGSRLVFEERHRLRLWLYEDFKAFCREGGFRIDGIYDQKFRPVPLDASITGELGALYMALVKE
jgi:SAM-dependent methyltransferase